MNQIQYETLFILDPRLPEEDVTALNDRITGLITTNGGEVLSTNVMGIRKLAFPIKKLEEGRYVLIVFKCETPLVSQLDRQMKLLQQIVRFKIIRNEE